MRKQCQLRGADVRSPNCVCVGVCECVGTWVLVCVLQGKWNFFFTDEEKVQQQTSWCGRCPTCLGIIQGHELVYNIGSKKS